MQSEGDVITKGKKAAAAAVQTPTSVSAPTRVYSNARREFDGDSMLGQEPNEVDELEEEPVGGGGSSDNEVEIDEPPRKQPVYLDISDDEEDYEGIERKDLPGRRHSSSTFLTTTRTLATVCV